MIDLTNDEMHKLQAKAVAGTVLRSLLIQEQARTGNLPTDEEHLAQCVAWVTEPLMNLLTIKASGRQMLVQLEQGLDAVRKIWRSVQKTFKGKSE